MFVAYLHMLSRLKIKGKIDKSYIIRTYYINFCTSRCYYSWIL